MQSTFAGADIVHFADNQTVNGIAVMNYLAAPDVGRMLSAYSLKLTVNLGSSPDPGCQFPAFMSPKNSEERSMCSL